MKSCMKLFRIYSMIVISLCLVSFSSCSDDDEIGNWVKSSDFAGPGRRDASCFVINRRAYVVGGYDGKSSSVNKRLKDIWEFNSDNGSWTQKADFPGPVRSTAFSFASDDKGYYGTGYDGIKYYDDFWEFDPIDNKWTQKSNFPGGERNGAIAFYLDGIGYAGCGYNPNYHMDMYKYDPRSDKWETGVSIQGSKRAHSSTFIIDNKAYVVGGVNNASAVKDFWMFDPETQTWHEKEQIWNKKKDKFDDDYKTIVRSNAVVLVIDGLAYFITGEVPGGGLNPYTWEYNPYTDRWDEKTKFKGASRTGAVGFSINNKGFVLTGSASTTATNLYLDDMWEFRPKEKYNKYD